MSNKVFDSYSMASQHNFASGATRQVFSALVTDDSGMVSSKFFVRYLESHGLLLKKDPRLKDVNERLRELGGIDNDVALDLDQFHTVTASCPTLIDKCVTGKLRIPDFKAFSDIIAEVFEKVEKNRGGKNADYIPQLAHVDPEQFGISVVTVDGQMFSIGDCNKPFCIQSCSKPLSYLIAQDKFGSDYVHNHVGVEPSGRKFNEMCLKEAGTTENPSRQIPHNPCINAGAIMAVSMVFPEEKDRETRLKKVLEIWKRLSGGDDAPIGYDDPTYKSESGSADRNWCLGYMMKESGAFPPCFSSLSDTLELYFQICSIMSTNEAMAIMSATLANGGLNPLSGDRVFAPDHIRNVLPIMLSSGMYDYSGKWAYDIGVPAKSGVGGCVFVVVPNVCGISIFSPRLDEVGNSTRGVAAATELVKHFSFHNFEVFSGLSRSKIDPTLPKHAIRNAALGELLFASSQGDLTALKAQEQAGIDLYASDYDARTALHLSASEGHHKCLEFLVNNIPDKEKSEVLNATDRWGGTPLGDAIQGGNKECIRVLREAKCSEGCAITHVESDESVEISDSASACLFSAAEGDLHNIVSLKAQGVDLFACDYDRRTALHLAASEGKTDVVRYLLAHAAEKLASAVTAVDRWGGSALTDAVRGNHIECVALLERAAASLK
eukprot:m.142145 g.142145  ORF g.142145 m.142145 type:complete len:664 (+) comp30233_c1_seq1:245-2236(+)